MRPYGCLVAVWISSAALSCSGPSLQPTPSPPPPPPSPIAATPPAPEAGPEAALQDSRPLNVLLITVDALRIDMPWAGYDKNIAPNLTALESQSVSFTHAYALSSFTAKSLGGMLAGRYPSELTRTFAFFTLYPPDNDMFPEVLQAAGVRTIGVQAHWSLKRDRGYSQGFDTWEMVPNLLWGKAADTQVTGELHTREIIKTLRGELSADRRWFAWAHYMDPHQLYQKHEGAPDFGDSDRGRYDGEVWYADRAIGELLAFVQSQPWGEHTAIMVTSDHGEAFGEHGMGGHAFELWESLVRVPWFVRLPGVAPRRLDTARSHIDLAPTVLELMDVPRPAWLRGTSLVAELHGAPPTPRTILCDLPEDSNSERRRAVIEGNL
jgi:choline-sulfatase